MQEGLEDSSWFLIMKFFGWKEEIIIEHKSDIGNSVF